MTFNKNIYKVFHVACCKMDACSFSIPQVSVNHSRKWGRGECKACVNQSKIVDPVTQVSVEQIPEFYQYKKVIQGI